MKIKNELHDQWRAGLVEYVLLDASLREAEKAGEGAGELRRRAMEIMRFDEGRKNLGCCAEMDVYALLSAAE